MSDESTELTIDEQIAAVIEPLKKLDAQLAQDEAHCRNELEEIIGKRKRLTAMLRQADPTLPGPGRKKNIEEPPTKKLDIGEGKITQVLGAVAGLEGEWNTGMVVGLTPLDRGSVNKALTVLRERGQVRLVKHGLGMKGGSVYVTTPRGAEDGQQRLEMSSNGST